MKNTPVNKAGNILDEKDFHRSVSRERKRSERSGESILLLMLDVKRIEDDASKKDVLEVASGPISDVIRETDACGWLDTGAVFGIMFTGIADTALAQAVQTVEMKVRESLFARLPHTLCQKIGFSTVTFPEKDNGNVEGAYFNPVFYPEIFHNDEPDRIPGAIKRAMDIFGSFMALVLLSPVFAAIAALIRLTSPGPILFKQKRIGQFGKPFTFLKFRSMYANNDDSIHRRYVRDLIANRVDCDQEEGKATVFKIRNDPRITPLGAFLRKTSLDELPQFFNVLKGEMSLVGPRPPVPYEVEDYGLWHRYRILAVKPGITGLWQVRGRSLTTFDGMVRLDIQYIRRWSLWLDLKLLLATPVAVLRGKGAY